MFRESKMWGERWLIRQDSTHAVSFLKVKKGFRCSWHHHKQKYNLFVVLSGKITIVTETGQVEVLPGQTFTTKPGEWHEFRGTENSEMIEEMYVCYDESDIIREKVGGVIAGSEMPK